MSNTEQKELTYRDIRLKVNAMSEEQLDQIAMILREEDSDTLSSIEAIESDIYRHRHDDEVCGTLEQLKEMDGEDFVLEDYEIATKAGRVFMYANF